MCFRHLLDGSCIAVQTLYVGLRGCQALSVGCLTMGGSEPPPRKIISKVCKMLAGPVHYVHEGL